jgi:hypothetical protein
MTIEWNDLPGFLLWLPCGTMTGSLPIILPNVVSAGFNAVLLVFRLRFGEATGT